MQLPDGHSVDPQAGDRKLPERARVVIIGGGVVGASVAYHLAAMGQLDVLLLEQGQLSGGTTWHAAGLVGQLRATESGTRLVQYSTDLYARLEREVGLGTGYKRCGGVTVARSADRMIQLQRTAATAQAYGLECEIISPAQAAERYPLLRSDDLLGALWLPGDATANPTDLTAALARGARLAGVRILERARVIGIETRDDQHSRPVVCGVAVEFAGDIRQIETEIVINCAGQWAKAVGALCSVTVPLHSAEHFFVVTDQIDGVHRDLPILRDPDGYTYFKEEVGGLVVGGFEPQAKPWVSPDQLPYPFEFQLLEEDWEHFSVLMDSAVHRIPVLQDTGIKKFYNGPESFTPDNQFILGEAPEVGNFFVAAGFNSVGIASAGGAGRALAEWVVNGSPTSDLTNVDIRRFARFHGNVQWLHDRVGEVLGLHYAVPWPNRELESGRPFRRSPVHSELQAHGASFGSKMGWERPNFFVDGGSVNAGSVRADPVICYGWGRQNWHDWSHREQLATRNAVALFDQTSFGKLLIVGPDAERALQWVCAADASVAVGRTVYTGLLNERGGYESDVTVTRTGREEYLLITGAASVIHDLDHLRRNFPADARVNVVDVTSSYAVFGVMGPNARLLLQKLSRTDLSEQAFGFATSQEIDLGHCTVRATRITYVGELGWELYVPAEFAVGVYHLLSRAGSEFGLVNAGYYALNGLRIEKGYRAFGSDITPDSNPIEAGLRFATKLDTDIDFLGRAALERAVAGGVSRRLTSLVVDDPSVTMWGGELLLRNGAAVGQVTSAAWGATIGSCVGLAYRWRADGEAVTAADLNGSDYQVNVGGTISSVTLSQQAPYDPKSLRTKS
jgi:4-methylaminobutanoate oxidase (formaldehyde-forming)